MSGGLGAMSHTAGTMQKPFVLGGNPVPTVRPCRRQRSRRTPITQAVSASPIDQQTEDIRATASRLGKLRRRVELARRWAYRVSCVFTCLPAKTL